MRTPIQHQLYQIKYSDFYNSDGVFCILLNFSFFFFLTVFIRAPIVRVNFPETPIGCQSQLKHGRGVLFFFFQERWIPKDKIVKRRVDLRTARFSSIFFMGQLYFSVWTIGKAILDIAIVLHGSFFGLWLFYLWHAPPCFSFNFLSFRHREIAQNSFHTG